MKPQNSNISLIPFLVKLALLNEKNDSQKLVNYLIIFLFLFVILARESVKKILKKLVTYTSGNDLNLNMFVLISCLNQ